ncbi:MotA/TolQ/ExbB proton channel family protein [Campylobacterota bacterium DY0563]
MFLIDLVSQLNLMEYINRGGIIVYILIALNILGFSIMLWKFIELFIAKFQKDSTAKKITNLIKENDDKYEEKVLRNALDKYLNKLESGLNTIKIIASISPLLGLLGTVIGVLNSFDSISKSGLGDPAIFSTGISIALITTVAGLIVAIPHYIGYNYLIGFIDNLEHKIEERIIVKL